MKSAAARLGLHFHRARPIAPILRAVVRRQHLKFRDGFRVRINVQRRIAAVIHVVAAVQLPVVVLGAPSVHAVGHVAVDTHLALVRAGLVDDTGREVDELREIASVQHQLIDLLAGDRGAHGRGLRFNLRHALARHNHFFPDRADSQLNVHANLLCHIQHNILRRIFLESLCRHHDVVRSAWQTGDNVCAIRVCESLGVSRCRSCWKSPRPLQQPPHPSCPLPSR